jgi:glycosyltransferase involved in cell wall biosynthesis
LLDLPSSFSRFEGQLERLPVCTYEDYLGYLAECDISIAPLENYIFNDSKSNIKYLEASIVKVPSVCSPRAAFAQMISHGENGFLCETIDEWEAALTLLVKDTAKRKQVSEAAYSSVMRHYSPESIAQKQVAPLLEHHDRNPGILRVLSVNCYYYPRSFGGATIVAEEVNKRINDHGGLEIHVFTTLPSSVAAPYTTRRYEADGINVYGVGLPEWLDEKTQFENPEIVDAFANVLAVVQPDIVHFHSIQGIGVCVLDLCTEKGIKYIVTLHDAWWLCGRQFMINKQGKFCDQVRVDLNVCGSCVDNSSLNLYRFERLNVALRNASALLAPSRFFADFYIANGFANVQVNKNGIVKPKSARRLRRIGSLRFGYVGGNTQIKGFHLVKKVFSDLAGFNVTLVLVDNALNLGFASYHQQDLVGIPNVEIVPAYTQNTIDDFFASIDVLLFPTQCKESFGLTVREALARNVWVITTDAGGVVEDIEPGRNGYLVPLSDTGEGLKHAVIDTMSHFECIMPGEEISLGQMDITFVEDQAAELATILKRVNGGNSECAEFI